ncbi:hypothetical protein EBU02_05730 [bacterium]|nr:hypothetical protein [bacterium]
MNAFQLKSRFRSRLSVRFALFEKQADLYNFDSNTRLSMDYDWKRAPDLDSVIIRKIRGGVHIYFETVPWNNSSEYEFVKTGDLLDMGRVENILDQSNTRIEAISLDNAHADIPRKDLGYFEENVVEAGCRTLIAERLKRSGMFWSLRGANVILASRRCQISTRFEDFWEDAA